MKAVLEKLFVPLEWITQPATGWFCQKSEQRKSKVRQRSKSIILSPESYNVRGVAARSQDRTRRNAAP